MVSSPLPPAKDVSADIEAMFSATSPPSANTATLAMLAKACASSIMRMPAFAKVIHAREDVPITADFMPAKSACVIVPIDCAARKNPFKDSQAALSSTCIHDAKSCETTEKSQTPVVSSCVTRESRPPALVCATNAAQALSTRPPHMSANLCQVFDVTVTPVAKNTPIAYTARPSTVSPVEKFDPNRAGAFCAPAHWNRICSAMARCSAHVVALEKLSTREARAPVWSCAII